MAPWVAEIIGTMILVLLGDGVVANVVLGKTKGQNSGWIVITTGWAMAVAVAVYAVGRISGAHINPAVTIALAVTNKWDPAHGFAGWGDVPLFIVGQFIGAFIGAVLVWLAYYPHWAETPDPALKRAVFCTAPNIRNYPLNFITEVIGTFMLVFGVLAITANKLAEGFAPLLVGFLVWAIGLSLGGPTGYAINPARDLGPRIAHAVLPIPGKGDSDWGYSWVPVVGPIVGGLIGAFLFVALGL
ncbi:MIP/aquaporin family protein [Thermoflexus sp.]|jgi:glycerol uptake facilitator protein|uniref:MIP/aquaporin family protein n=1 Tax=Thermoflexus sp. TaxID=1969742 RepID=UPI003C080FEC